MRAIFVGAVLGIAMLAGPSLTVQAAGAAEPQAAGPGGRLVREWLAEKLQADFRAHGNKEAAWAGRLATFHESFAANAAIGFFDDVQLGQLEALGAELVMAGCNDPVFLLCTGRVEIALGRHQEAMNTLRRHIGAVGKAGYPPLYNVLGRTWMRLVQLPNLPVRPPDKAFCDAALALAADKAFAGPNARVFVQLVIGEENGFAAVAAERIAKPDSGIDPWIAALLQGRDEIGKAWAARGAGFAAAVTPDGWAGFKAHLAKARERLTKAHEMHPDFPEAATEMITVSMGDDSGEAETWFERAVAAEFDHLPAYTRLLRGPLRPRWGGSHEAMLAFGRRCLDSGRFETRVPTMFLDAVLAIGEDMDGPRDAVALPGVHEDWARACKAYIEASRLPEQVRIWKSRLAAGHWAAGEHAAACAVLDELRDDLAPRVALEFRTPVADIAGESRLYAGRHAEVFREVEGLIAEKETERAIEMLGALAARDDLPAAGRRIIAGRIAGLKRSAALASQEWVDLQPNADLAGWRVVAGDWKVEPDGALLGSSRGPGMLKIVCQSDLGQDLEFNAWVDLCDYRDPERRWERCVVMLGYSTEFDDSNTGLGVQLYRSAQKLWLRRGFSAIGEIVNRAPLKSRNRLRIVLWDGKVSVWVNGVKPVDKLEVPEEWLTGGRLAIGEFTDGRPQQVRIRGMRARRLERPSEDF